VNPGIAARLESLDIRLMAETSAYALFARGDCMALARRAADGFDSIGGSGMMTENGVAYLLWRDGEALLAVKGQAPAPAAPAQVELILRFSLDLKEALRLNE